MNENRHPLDDLFRDGLDQYSVEPPMHVWERIDQTRTPVYKLTNNFKQNARWYMSVAAGLALLSSAAIMILKDDEPEVSALTQPTTEITAQQDGNQVTDPASKEAPATLGYHEAVSGQSESSEVTEPQLAQTQPATGAVRQSVSATPENRTFRQNSPVQNPPVAGQQPEGRIEQEEVPFLVETPEQKEGNIIGQEITGVTEQPEIQAEEETTEELAVLTEETATEPADEVSAPAPAKEQKTNAAPPITPSPWFVEAVGSYDFVNRNFQHPDANYVSARKQYEKISSAYTFQLRAGYAINPILSLRSGISFSRINEKLDYSYSYEKSQIVDRQERGYILDPINGPQQITYTVKDTIHQSGITRFNSNNQYTFIDIPVLLSYQVYGSNKWNFGVSGGPVFNLAFRQNGNILAPSVADVINLNGTSNPYKGYAGVNLMLNLNASYTLNKHFDVVFEPGMRFGISSLTSSPMGMTQRYNSLNLFSGLRYKF